jgi:hypothetical protein
MSSRKSVFDRGDFSEKTPRGANIVSSGDEHFGPDPEDAKTEHRSRTLLRLDKTPQRLSNLTQRQKKLDELSPVDETRLLAAARAGDANATRTLILHHLDTVQKYALGKWRRLNPPKNQYDERGLTADDFVAAGIEGLLRAICAFRPGANNGLNAFARPYIAGALADVARDWRNRGIKAESRLQRLIRSHPHWDVFQLRVEYMKRYPGAAVPSLNKIVAEQDVAFTLWQPDKYDETSTFTDAGDHTKDGDCMGGGSAFLGSDTGYEGGPTSEYWRQQATGRLHPSRKRDGSDWVTGERCGSIFAERVLAERDSSAIAEIKKIGRRAYAQGLVEQERERPKVRENSPSLTSIPLVPRPIRHVVPLPGPGQDPENSYWDYTNRDQRMFRRSLNITVEREAPPPKPSPFEAAIASIGSVDIAPPSNNYFKKAA